MTSAALPLILWLSYYLTESHTLVRQDFPLVKPCWVCLLLPVHQQEYTSFDPPFLTNVAVQALPVILCVSCQVQFQFCQLCSTTLFPKIPQTISLNSWKSVLKVQEPDFTPYLTCISQDCKLHQCILLQPRLPPISCRQMKCYCKIYKLVKENCCISKNMVWK